MLYSAVSEAARTKDTAKAKDAIAQITDRYAGTGYAPRAALLYAKMLYDAGDRNGAKAQLAWVVEHANEDELKAIARYRLAQVQIDEKQYDAALATLDAKHPDVVRRRVRRPARRRARRRRTRGRRAHRVRDGAREARSEVAVPQLRAGEARRARRRRRNGRRRGRTPAGDQRGADAAPRTAAKRRGATARRRSGEMTRAACVRASAARARRGDAAAPAARACRESPLTSWMPSIPRAVVRVADRRQQQAGTAARRSTRRSRRESTGSRASARRGPAFAPAITPSAIYAAASDGTLMRLDPATGRVEWRVSAGQRAVGGAGRRRLARRRRHRQGRRARVRRRRQGAAGPCACRAK